MKKRKTEFYSLLFQEAKDDLGRFVHRSKYLILDKNAADPSVLPKLRAKFDFVNKYLVLKGNKAFSVKDDMLFSSDGKTLISCPPATRHIVYAIPRQVTKISNFAFECTKTLAQLYIPSSVKDFGLLCFADNPNLERVEFEPGQKKIDLSCFFGCFGLKYGYVDPKTCNIVLSRRRAPKNIKCYNLNFDVYTDFDLSIVSKNLILDQEERVVDKNLQNDEKIRLKAQKGDEDLWSLIYGNMRNNARWKALTEKPTSPVILDENDPDLNFGDDFDGLAR